MVKSLIVKRNFLRLKMEPFNLKELIKANINWKQLASVDGDLVKTMIDTTFLNGHKIEVGASEDSKESEQLRSFLSNEYKSCLKTCKFEMV